MGASAQPVCVWLVRELSLSVQMFLGFFERVVFFWGGRHNSKIMENSLWYVELGTCL